MSKDWMPPLPDWITPGTGWAKEFEQYALAAVEAYQKSLKHVVVVPTDDGSWVPLYRLDGVEDER